LAAIGIVARGVAFRVSVSGRDIAVGLAHEPVQMAEGPHSGPTMPIGKDGLLGMVIHAP
jgi:hypothetical protein